MKHKELQQWLVILTGAGITVGFAIADRPLTSEWVMLLFGMLGIGTLALGFIKNGDDRSADTQKAIQSNDGDAKGVGESHSEAEKRITRLRNFGRRYCYEFLPIRGY